MSLDTILLAVVDGLSYAGLLFLVALGLTLIFGVMGILNVAHGSLYAFGGYMAATLVLWATGLGQAPTLVLVAALFASALAMGGVLGAPGDRTAQRNGFQDKDRFCSSLSLFGAFLIRSRRRAAFDLGAHRIRRVMR